MKKGTALFFAAVLALAGALAGCATEPARVTLLIGQTVNSVVGVRSTENALTATLAPGESIELTVLGGSAAWPLTVSVRSMASGAVTLTTDRPLYPMAGSVLSSEGLTAFVVVEGRETRMGERGDNGASVAYTFAVGEGGVPGEDAPSEAAETVPVTQPDILACTRRLLHDNKPAFTAAELSLIGFLDLNDTGVTDLSDLAYYENLTDLSLRGSKLSDLATLKNAPHLSVLDLTDSGLTDLSALPKLTSLATLCLDGNAVADLSPLSRLPALSTLSVTQRRCVVTAYAPLEKCKRLTSATLPYGASVTDPAALSRLHGLTALSVACDGTAPFNSAWLNGLRDLSSLTLSCGADADLSALYLLPSLTELSVDGGPGRFFDIARCINVQTLTVTSPNARFVAPLAQMERLETLTIDAASVLDIRALAESKSLRTLTVTGAKDADMAYLREHMPKARVLTGDAD